MTIAARIAKGICSVARITILLPTYNGEAFLSEQLDSILAQTDGDFDLLALDDGSTDATRTLLDHYAARDARIRVIPATGNAGQVNRINEMVALATAPYLSIADQDDIWHPERNARLLAAIGDRPMAFGQSLLIDRDGREQGGTLLQAMSSDADPAAPLKALFRAIVSAHGMIVRRNWVGGRSLGGALPFDEALALEAIFSGGLAYAPDAIVRHRIHGNNQANGGVAPRRRLSLASPQRIMTSLSFRQPTRLHFWLALTHLAHARRIDSTLRRTCLRLAARCFDAWYSQSHRPHFVDSALRTLLEEAFRPRAGSDEDWRYFSERLDIVTRSMLHPSNLRQAFWQYRSA